MDRLAENAIAPKEGAVQVNFTYDYSGGYTLFTIPNQDKWTLIVSEKTKNAKGGQLWGVPYPGEGDDLVRVDGMKVSSVPSPVENFTISFGHSGSACTLQMDWDTTRATIDISEKN